MKSVILFLSLGLSLAASSAFADQCPSGDDVKINDDYSVVAPDGYHAIHNWATKKEPVTLLSTELSSLPYGAYSDDPRYANITAAADIICRYSVDRSQGGGLILGKNDSANQAYDLGGDWSTARGERYVCFPEDQQNADCSFILSAQH